VFRIETPCPSLFLPFFTICHSYQLKQKRSKKRSKKRKRTEESKPLTPFAVSPTTSKKDPDKGPTKDPTYEKLNRAAPMVGYWVS
jgi:hypothetical protein